VNIITGDFAAWFALKFNYVVNIITGDFAAWFALKLRKVTCTEA
jgi:hypothetical protein